MNSKIVFLFFALVAVAYSSPTAPAPADDVADLLKALQQKPRISELWLEKHGCPSHGSFLLNCNSCNCPVAGKKQPLACTDMLCWTETKDDYAYGQSCEPNREFFSGCKICKCNDDGFSAECDDSVCKQYYSHV